MFGVQLKKLSAHNQAPVVRLIVFLAFFSMCWGIFPQLKSRKFLLPKWPSWSISCLNRRPLNFYAINYCWCFKFSRKRWNYKISFLMQQHNLSLHISSKLNSSSESNSSCLACFPIGTLGIKDRMTHSHNWASQCFSSHWRFQLKAYENVRNWEMTICSKKSRKAYGSALIMLNETICSSSKVMFPLIALTPGWLLPDHLCVRF